MSCGRLTKKESEPHGFEQARSGDLHSLFLSALRMRWLRHRPAASVRASSFANLAARSIKQHQGTRNAITQRRGSPRSMLHGFAKQTEKGFEDRWESLLSHPSFKPFFNKLPQLIIRQAMNKRRFFGTFLTQESTVPPYKSSFSASCMYPARISTILAFLPPRATITSALLM